MSNLESQAPRIIDMHCHVGVLGDQHPEWGSMSQWFCEQLVYRVFLLYAGIDPANVSDDTLQQATLEALGSTEFVKGVVCLALDKVYGQDGKPNPDGTTMWVSNDYILELRRLLGDKVLLGASVHPYDPDFQDRVRRCVDQGAVLLKWLPSAQQFDLADPRVKEALVFLATVRDGGPLPLLLHVGPEYAIESMDERTSSYDLMSWTWWDRIANQLRGAKKWHSPRLMELHHNLRTGLDAGGVVIFAHCGLPYYAPSWMARALEHSDLRTVTKYLLDYPADGSAGGRCYADVSACATPFRRSYFDSLHKLPPESLIFGTDFPTPVFDLLGDAADNDQQLDSVLEGALREVLVPEGNLIDFCYHQMASFFPSHPMFTNFATLL